MKTFIKEWLMPIGAAVILCLLINRFLFFNIQVPSESMLPTIQIGDRIVTTKIYNPSKLKRGDIIVFYFEEDNEKLVKRLIGLPGDKVEVKAGGSVYVNSIKLDEPYVKYQGGASGTFNVPSASYFFLGDNRSNSYDSRLWKNPYISSSDILGKAQIVFYPFNRFGALK